MLTNHRIAVRTALAVGSLIGALAAGPRLAGQSPDATPAAASPSTSAPATAPASFEVVSIKASHDDMKRIMIRMAPGGRFEANNISLRFLLQEAFGVKDSQLAGVPGWADSDRFNIDAKANDDDAEAERQNRQRQDRDAVQTQLRQMLQGMLADRFKLAVHHETKELPQYALVVAKNGPKFHETTAPPMDMSAPPPSMKPGGPVPRGGIRMMGRGDLNVTGVRLSQFADVLSRQIGTIVVDKTGLKGEYDFSLKWTPEEGQGQMFGGAGAPPAEHPPSDASGPSIFAALQEQLGLKLESTKGPVDTVVIDHVEKPSEN